ncbi:TPA: hypothetical protein EYP13_02410, partial [Candidatus Micrarchaeota archaeon]|nr:hypothetical protein [Candidatus Micrarchaeota archaeon]
LHAVLNPHYIPNVPQPSRWNAGFLTYLTFRDVAADYDWLAAVSVYTDTCVAPWNQHLVNRFGYDVVRRAGDLLTAFIATTDDLSELDYVLLNEIHNIKDVISDERFIRAEREFESTVAKYVNDPKSHALLWDETRKVAVIETREAYLQINSVVSTRISLLPRFRDWIIVVIGKDPDSDGYKASIRCQNWEKRGHMGELARKICERIGGKGGGHPPAAGLRIPRGKKEALVEALQSLL